MRKNSGNVLFLILIAVALFAALSYAVTQSSRSGGGNASKEKMELDVSAVFQHIVSLRTGVLRFSMSKGVAPTDLHYGHDYNNASQEIVGVFHPSGGNVIVPWKYEEDPGLPLALYEGGEFYSPWSYNWVHEIKEIGSTSSTTISTPQTADVIAFAPGLSQQACQHINEKAGIGTVIPEFSATQVFLTSGIGSPGGGASVLGNELTGKMEGCYKDLTNNIYVLYAVIAAR